MEPPSSNINRMAALSVSGTGGTAGASVATTTSSEKTIPTTTVTSMGGTSFQGYPGTAPALPVVVPMKFYANWEVDRASNSATQRVLLLAINRFSVLNPDKIDSSFVIAVRLQGHKRTLRSNDINLVPGSSEVSLDISFTLQYSHYFKRKINTLQLLIQRRKRYKNRHIPGFKTLAIGHLNLDDVLQLGGVREIRVWDTAYLNKNEPDLNELSAGTIFVSNCISQGAADPTPMSKHSATNNGIPISEEDEDDSTDDSDFDVDHFGEPSSSNRYPSRGGMKQRLRNQRKKLNQRNIKSKLTALLKRFKAQDAGTDPSCSGTLPPPTEEELEQIFEELENISDSGPELEPDNVSIVSNPKPGLRPFFGSKTDILPAIEDGPPYETSPGDSDDSVSDNENAHPPIYYAHHGFSTSLDSSRSVKQSRRPTSGNLEHRVQSSKVTPSGTANSIASTSGGGGDVRYLSTVQNRWGASGKKISDVSVIMEMMSYLEDPNSFIASNVWLCSSADASWLANVEAGQFKTVKLIDCSTANEVRAALQAIVARIQKFCNSNSVPPPQTVIGLLGGDKLVVNVLRVYVELLQNKTHQDWLNYLRFTLIVSPTSVVGRALTSLGDSGFAENQWRALNKVQPGDLAGLEACLLAAGQQETIPGRAVNIPIGEVMLQLDASASENENMGTTVGSDGQVFIPFIAEIHLGNVDELNSLHYMEEKPSIASTSSAPASTGINANLSPPMSPHISKPSEWKELQIEYWTAASANNNDFVSPGSYHAPMSTPKSSSGGKFSMKAAVRTLSVAREPLSTLLSMLFVKERKKDKMLQKLGRKAKPRSSDSFNSQSRVVSSVSRMICSGKHTQLDLSIDGATWSKVRFFQITSQWQTHVKFFPISVPIPHKSRGD